MRYELGPSSKTSRLGAVSWIVRFCRIKDHAGEFSMQWARLHLLDGFGDLLFTFGACAEE